MLMLPNNLVLAETSDNALQTLLQISPNERFPLLIVSIVFSVGLIVALVAVIGGFVHTANRHRLEADLKRELLDRGLSPEEVARVVEASASKTSQLNRRDT